MSGRRRPSHLAMIPVVAIAFGLGIGTGSFFGATDAGATSRLSTVPTAQFAKTARPTTLTGSKPSSTKAAVTHDLAYDLAEANGKVVAVGKAAYYGSASEKHLVAPVVALVSTPDHKGYWLIGADASVFPFGDARNEGGAGGKVRRGPGAAAAAVAGGRGRGPCALP